MTPTKPHIPGGDIRRLKVGDVRQDPEPEPYDPEQLARKHRERTKALLASLLHQRPTEGQEEPSGEGESPE